MADQVGTDIRSGAQPDGGALSENAPGGTIAEGGAPGHYEPYHGRPVSWVAVGIIVAGFLAGGIALIAGPTWWVFWVGAGLVVVGGLVAMSTDIFEDWY
jgi:hypothetical protein